MRIKWEILLPLLCLPIYLFAQPADSPWPMYQHDARHTGRVDVMSPESPHVDWIFAPIGRGISMPIIDEDSTIYFHSTVDTLFYALYPDGTVKWIYKYNGSGGISGKCGVVGEDYLHFVRNTWETDGGSYWSYYHILNKDGTLYWQNDRGGTYWYYNRLYSSPIMGTDGTIYVVGDSGAAAAKDVKLYAFDDTLLLWTSFLKQAQSGTTYPSIPAVGPDGTIYIALDDSIYAINPDGTRKWSMDRGKGDLAVSVGSNGSIYFVSGWYDSLTAVDPSGNVLWKWGSPSSLHSIHTVPAIGWGVTLYFVYGKYLMLLTADGDSIFTIPFGDFADNLIVTQNMLYLTRVNCKDVFAFTHSGKLKWKYNISDAYGIGINGIAMSYDGIIVTYHEYNDVSKVLCIREGNYAVELLHPNGGENLSTSQPDTIRWNSQNVDSVSLYYTLESSDNIIDYTPIIEKIPNTDEYIWHPPDTSCSSVRVAVVATDTRGSILALDMSDSNFTIDNTHPESWVDSLPRFINSLSFEITWHGYDPGDGSGLDYFDVQYKDNDGSWIDWLMETTDTTKIFTGQENHRYYFRCRGVDKSGNIEPYPSYDTYTYIDITQPTITDVTPIEDGLAGGEPVIHAVVSDPSPGSGLILDSIKVIFDDTLAYHYPGGVTYDDYTGEVGFKWYCAPLSYGMHTMTISAMDSATNWFSVTRNFQASLFVDKKWELVGNMGRLGGDDTCTLYDESQTEEYLQQLLTDDYEAVERLCLGEDVMFRLECWTEGAVWDFMWAFTDLKILSDGCVDNIRRQVEAWVAEDSAVYADSIESATDMVGRIVDEYEEFIDIGISIVDEVYGTGFGDVKTYISVIYDLTSPNDDAIIYSFRQMATRIVMNSFLRITQPSLDDILNNAITHNFTGTYGEAQQATGGLMAPDQYPDGSVLKTYKDWYEAADASICDYIGTAQGFEFVSYLFGIFGAPIGGFDFGVIFQKWSETIAAIEYLRAMQVALRYYVGVADTSTGGIREGTILAFFPDSSVSKTTLNKFIPQEVIEKFKAKFRDAKDDYETCLLHIQQLVDNGEVDSVRLLLPTLVELDRQYSFQSRISKAPILAVADTAYAANDSFADALFDLHIKFVNSNLKRHRVNGFIRGFMSDSTYKDSVEAQVPVVIAINDTLEGMTSEMLDSVSSYPASPMVLPSDYQVKDRVNVGDTFSLHASIINGGADIAHNVKVQLVTPSAVNVVGENEFYIGDLNSGNEAEVTWSLICREAGGPVSLTIAPRADNGKSMSKTVNIMTEYTIAPEIGGVTVDSQVIEPYDYVIINAYVTGVKPISSVYAIITRPGEPYREQVRLYDDGSHYDGESGDHLYGYRWKTPSTPSDYYVSIIAEDENNNTRTRGNVVGFTTKEFNKSRPSTMSVDKQNDVLLVNDNLDRYEIVNDDTTIVGGDIESYYRNSLDNLNTGYDVWRTISRGEPSDTILEMYRKNGCVIWANGAYEGSVISGLDAQNAIKWYLGREGKLFISGQDIGWGLTKNGSESNSLFENYLHTSFTADDSRDFDLNGVTGDHISDGLNISISGGSGANNQKYPDVIEPSGKAVSIFNYSSGLSGGVRTEDRIVYFSFGFESINSEADRDIILTRMFPLFNQPPVIDSFTPLSPCSTFVDSALSLYVYAHDIDVNDTLTYGWIINRTLDTTTYTGTYSYLSPEETIDTVKVMVSDGTLADSVIWIVNTKSVGIESKPPLLPKVFFLSQNFPNPFMRTTEIRYGLPQDADMSIVIYKILGQKVATLVNRNQKAGYYTTRWSGINDFGRRVASGIYFYRLKAEKYISTRKMYLIR